MKPFSSVSFDLVLRTLALDRQHGTKSRVRQVNSWNASQRPLHVLLYLNVQVSEAFCELVVRKKVDAENLLHLPRFE